MDNSAKKPRSRSTNFLKEECEILCNLVDKHKDIIENKTSDATTWKKKEETWTKIALEFNALCGLGGPRCAKTLKHKYEALKRLTRKKSATIRQEMYRTGGGPNTAPDLDPVEEKIKSMILLSCDGLESVYDSDVFPGSSTAQDATYVDEMTPPVTTEDYIITQDDYQNERNISATADEDHLLGELQSRSDTEPQQDLDSQPEPKIQATPQPSTSKWDALSRKKLRTKINPALKCSRVMQPSPTMDQTLSARLELIDLQKKLVQEELAALQRKVEREEEDHQKKMKILDLELLIMKKKLE